MMYLLTSDVSFGRAYTSTAYDAAVEGTPFVSTQIEGKRAAQFNCLNFIPLVILRSAAFLARSRPEGLLAPFSQRFNFAFWCQAVVERRLNVILCLSVSTSTPAHFPTVEFKGHV